MSNFSGNQEALFWDNVRYNASMAKGKGRPRIKGVVWRDDMTPDEVLERLKKHDINISKRTLLRWEQAGLVPEAKRGSAGRGKGKITDYPDSTPAEAYASYDLMNGFFRIKAEDVKEIRHYALQMEQGGLIQIVKDKSPEEKRRAQQKAELARSWLGLRIRSELGIDDPGESLIVIYTIKLDDVGKSTTTIDVIRNLESRSREENQKMIDEKLEKDRKGQILYGGGNILTNQMPYYNTEVVFKIILPTWLNSLNKEEN